MRFDSGVLSVKYDGYGPYENLSIVSRKDMLFKANLLLKSWWVNLNNCAFQLTWKTFLNWFYIYPVLFCNGRYINIARCMAKQHGRPKRHRVDTFSNILRRSIILFLDQYTQNNSLTSFKNVCAVRVRALSTKFSEKFLLNRVMLVLCS